MSKKNPMIARTLALAASTVALGSGIAQAGTTAGAVTISLSGSTAMRGFTTSAQFTALTPGASLSLANGNSYSAEAVLDPNSGPFPSIQLGGSGANGPVPQTNFHSAIYTAFRAEWHEQGSVEGILEMANDQIGYTSAHGPLINTDRNPTPGNPTWINGLTATPAGGLTGYVGQSGGSLVTTTANLGGFSQSDYNTYSGTTYDLATGRNLQGGQNRVQMAISDVTAKQGFSSAGTGAYNLTPGMPGYGKGNPRLAAAGNTSGVGVQYARQQLVDTSSLNMGQDVNDPSTGAPYTQGAWNTAGIDNLVNKKVAITATTFAANPGTGLTKVNRTDAQFLQAAGRLANGADFNVTTRDVNSGTRNVASLNVGLDPSFAVGENDDGNTGAFVGASDPQQSIGTGIRFSGKTAGGNGLRPTVQNSRMAIGHLSISDIRSGNSAGTSANANAGARPLRALAYRDDANDTVDGSNATIEAGFADPAVGFVKPSFASVTDGSYVIYQNETYVTVRTPDANYGNDGSIKGDYATQDVKQFRDNILNSAATFPGSGSLLNPANGLVSNGFLPTQYMKVTKSEDGLHKSTANPAFSQSIYDNVPSVAVTAFDVADAGSVTIGSNSFYGNITAANGGISITNNNYLFGDFDNDGDRDFADVKIATAAQDKLAQTAAGVTYTTGAGASNAQVVDGLTGALSTMAGYDGTTGAKRGDLIVKGDFNSDGNFDGKDLYLLAHGAALADSTATDTLTVASGATFGDQLRKGVLRKNAALDYLKANATDAQKSAASVNGSVNTNDDAVAFDKLDVNRDGTLSRVDAQIIDTFVGKNITSLTDQLGATIATNGTVDSTLPQRVISLVDVELDDNLDITAVLASGTSDFQVAVDGLGSLLKAGDANFDGTVNFNDLVILAQHYNGTVDRWSLGDFTLDGTVNFNDLVPLAQNYSSGTLTGDALAQAFAQDWQLAQSLVPEPTTAIVAIGLTFATATRARRRIVR